MMCLADARGPSDWELQIARFGAHIASIALARDRSIRAVRESERHFRELIDALPAAIYATDDDGRLTHYNRAAIEFSGHTPELGTDHWCITWKLYYLNGYDVCKRIRKQSWDKKVLIVAISGWGQEQDRKNSSEAGFDYHLVKPVDFTALLDLLAGP